MGLGAIAKAKCSLFQVVLCILEVLDNRVPAGLPHDSPQHIAGEVEIGRAPECGPALHSSSSHGIGSCDSPRGLITPKVCSTLARVVLLFLLKD